MMDIVGGSVGQPRALLTQGAVLWLVYLSSGGGVLSLQFLVRWSWDTCGRYMFGALLSGVSVPN